ncbi:MAG: hypothetical protein K0S61_2567 [Anaerocolumna sp.]|jgi:hypothetical protein|nr:hypothetical protein [Anaerocolumna sp.]
MIIEEQNMFDELARSLCFVPLDISYATSISEFRRNIEV